MAPSLVQSAPKLHLKYDRAVSDQWDNWCVYKKENLRQKQYVIVGTYMTDYAKPSYVAFFGDSYE